MYYMTFQSVGQPHHQRRKDLVTFLSLVCIAESAVGKQQFNADYGKLHIFFWTFLAVLFHASHSACILNVVSMLCTRYYLCGCTSLVVNMPRKQWLKARSQYDTRLYITLPHTPHWHSLQHNEMLGCIDSDPILALLCIAFLRLIMKNHEYSHITLA